MLQSLYSLKDSKKGKLGTYEKPLMAEEKVLIRELSTIVNAKNENPMAQYPMDFDLFEIGSFDSDTGHLIPLDAPRHILKLDSLKV